MVRLYARRASAFAMERKRADKVAEMVVASADVLMEESKVVVEDVGELNAVAGSSNMFS